MQRAERTKESALFAQAKISVVYYMYALTVYFFDTHKQLNHNGRGSKYDAPPTYNVTIISLM